MSGVQQLENRLALETSPYLLQHKDNPVAWQPWQQETFALARETNKPILLSVGYAACHWCHVMAHECFENPDIARLMNAFFINIKVDREVRPDVDQIYQAALAMLGQHGGWPLTMFLTPDGHPFWGGTYFPPIDRYGRPGFPTVLHEIARVYAEEPDKVAGNVGALRENLHRLTANKAGQGLDLGVVDMVADRLLQEVDLLHGGIGSAPKFPQCSILQLFWRAGHRTTNADYRTAVINALVHMSQGGIYDHLGGGYARYATDDIWLVPHFEKMLYDNAQLIDLLVPAWQRTRNPLFEERIRETISWLEREMLAHPDSQGRRGFASSLDADSEGEEGRYYVWSEEAIDRLLRTNVARFKEVYNVTSSGNWDGKIILNRLDCLDRLSEGEEGQLADQRKTLFHARELRERPSWDDKVLADWNGLTIAALAQASQLFEVPRWLQMAVSAYEFIKTSMAADGARLYHSWRGGQAKQEAFLDDYAAMCRAGLTLYELTGDSRYLSDVRSWIDILDQDYWDEYGGGYFMTAPSSTELFVRPKSVYDNATPSGNGLVLEGLARLYYLTGEDRWRDRADSVVTAFTGEVSRNIFPLATFLNAFELFVQPTQIVIIGSRAEVETETMVTAVFQSDIPTRVLLVVEPGAALPKKHPAAGKTPIDARPTTYVCHGPTCSPPVTDAESLRALFLGTPQ